MWRHVETRDGVAGPSELVCYTPSMGPLASPALPGWRCDAGRAADTADGYSLVQRCVSPQGETRDVRSTITGDLASAFNVTTELPGAGRVTSTWLRMGGCPDGMAPGQRRADGFLAAPPPPPAPRPAAAPARSAATAPERADPIGDVLFGTTSDESAAPAQADRPTEPAPAPAATDPAAKPG